MTLFLFFQSATPVPSVTVPERVPATLTLIYLAGLTLIALLLLVSLFRNRRRGVITPLAVAEDLPKAVKRRLGSTSTNRGLRALRWLFVLLAVGVFGFHVYWTHYARKQRKVSGTKLQRFA